VASLDARAAFVNALGVSPHGDAVVSAHHSMVFVWTRNESGDWAKTTSIIQTPAGFISSVSVSASGLMAMAVQYSESVDVVRLKDGRIVKRVPCTRPWRVRFEDRGNLLYFSQRHPPHELARIAVPMR